MIVIFSTLFSDLKFSLGTNEQKSPLEDMPFSETDINLEIPFAEQAANLKDNSVGKMYKDGGGDTLHTVCFLFIAISVFTGEWYCLNDIYLTLSELG